MQNAKLLNYLHLHFIVFIWGFTAVLGALINLDAVALVWYRMWIAWGFVLIYMLIRRENLRFSYKVLMRFALSGIIIAAHWLTFFWSIKESKVSVTLAVLSTGAFFASILEPIFYKRKIVWYEVAFGLVVMAGLYLIFDLAASYTLGITLALIAAFLSALFSVLNGKLVLEHKASAISFYELLFGAMAITIFLAFTDGFDAEFFQLGASDWFYLILLATGCTAYAFIASIYVMRWINPYTVMLTINMEPIYGIALALLILGEGERMDSQFYIGAGIILVTVLANGVIKMMSERKQRRLPSA